MTKKWLIEMSLAVAAIVLMVLASFVCDWWAYKEETENKEEDYYREGGFKLSLTEQTVYVKTEEDGEKDEEEDSTDYSDSEFEENFENTVKTFKIVQYLAYGSIVVGVLFLVTIILPGADIVTIKKETVISVALLAVFLCFVAPLFLMFQLPTAFEHDLTEDGADDDEDSPLTSFWGSNSESDDGNSYEETWGGSTGWFLFIIAGSVQIASIVTIILNKVNYGPKDQGTNISVQAYPGTGVPPVPGMPQHYPGTAQQYPGAAQQYPGATQQPFGMAPGMQAQQKMTPGQAMPGPHPGQAVGQAVPPSLSRPLQQAATSYQAGQPAPVMRNQIRCTHCGHIATLPQGSVNYKMGCPRCGNVLTN